MERAVELMSVRPREILRVERVAVEAGCVADLTVVDPDAAWTVDAERFASKSRNTGFAGAELLGRATMFTWRVTPRLKTALSSSRPLRFAT